MNDLEKFKADLLDAVREMKMRKRTRPFRTENYLCEASIPEYLAGMTEDGDPRMLAVAMRTIANYRRMKK